MKIEIELSDVFAKEYKKDKFKETFERVLADIKDGTVCGNYERETVEGLLDAFSNSRISK